jgi:hypothetical protein
MCSFLDNSYECSQCFLINQGLQQLVLLHLAVSPRFSYIMGEVKSYLRGLAVCLMWSPSLGLELCMRNYWISLGGYPSQRVFNEL